MLKNLRGRWRPPPLAFFCPRPTFRRSLISRGSILDRISRRKRGDYSQSRTGCKTNSLRNSGRPFELSGKNLNLVSCSHELRVLSSKSKLWKHISLTMYRNRAIWLHICFPVMCTKLASHYKLFWSLWAFLISFQPRHFIQYEILIHVCPHLVAKNQKSSGSVTLVIVDIYWTSSPFFSQTAKACCS